MRIVVDANVFVSALISPGSASDALMDAWTAGRIEVIASPQLLAEVEDVVLRPKFRRWFDEETGRLLIQRLRADATLFEDHEATAGSVRTRDPNDDYLLALAEDADAEALITGDRDLLEDQQVSVMVATPRALLERLR